MDGLIYTAFILLVVYKIIKHTSKYPKSFNPTDKISSLDTPSALNTTIEKAYTPIEEDKEDIEKDIEEGIFTALKSAALDKSEITMHRNLKSMAMSVRRRGSIKRRVTIKDICDNMYRLRRGEGYYK